MKARRSFLNRRNSFTSINLPTSKLHYLPALNDAGECTLMFGDGLNDAGALKKRTLGAGS
ncbi:MAG: hypothetical protein R2813_09515 [Flavobacteriales bacterium]